MTTSRWTMSCPGPWHDALANALDHAMVTGSAREKKDVADRFGISTEEAGRIYAKCRRQPQTLVASKGSAA